MNKKQKHGLILALLLMTSVPVGVGAIVYYHPQEISESLPPADVPHDLRVANYWGGSCYHASAQVALRWADQGEIADRWRSKFGKGATTSMITSRLDYYDVDYKVTRSGDVEVLNFAHNTRRVAAITYYPRHAINFLGWAIKDGQEFAVVLDNNRTSNFIFIPKQTFINNWQNRYGGSAIVPLVDPPPRKPYDPRDFEI